MGDPPPTRPDRAPREVAVGLAVTGAKGARLAWRTLGVARRVPLLGAPLRRAESGLAASGRATIDAARDELDAAPATIARVVTENRLVEQVADELLASGRLEEVVDSVLTSERTDRLLASPQLERLTAEVVERVLASSEVRAVLARQTVSFVDELAGSVLRRARGLDDQAGRDEAVAYGGLAVRTVAFSVDAVFVSLLAGIGAAVTALVGSLVGTLRPEWLIGALGAVGWTFIAGAYFVVCWTELGQTPGLRLMHLRVTRADGSPLSAARSLVRFVALGLAIVPLFAGLLPVLFDRRRRGLHDFVAGTVVYRDEVTRAQ